jgi:transposase-like protein
MALMDVWRKGEDPQADFLQEGVRWLAQELMEAEVSAQIGAGRYERTTQRNGYRTRPWDTRGGTLELAMPKLRTGSYFPSWLEARKRGEQALISVVAAAYVQGVSTRKVEALVQSLGIAGISKSEVSRMAASLEGQVDAFRTRRLDAEYPYVWIDARYEYVREDQRVQSMAVVIAYGVRADGVRAVLGLDIGLSEDVAVWRTFLQGLVARGVRGVKALAERFPAVTQLLLDAEGEILTCYDFPPEQRRQIYSTNPLERLNKELKRRSAVVGLFPNRAAVLRLFGALLAEQNDEWLVAGHRYMSEVSLRKLFRPPEEEMSAQLEAKTA